MSRFEVRFFDPATGRFVSRAVDAVDFNDAVVLALNELFAIGMVAENGAPPEADMVRRIR